jgi:hypothetical protein
MRRIFILFVVVFIVSPFAGGAVLAQPAPWQGSLYEGDGGAGTALQTSIVEELTTPIQNRLLKKSWRDASAEELADAFVEAVLGYELTFDVLRKIERAKGDVYKRTEIVFDPENPEYVRTLRNGGYHVTEKGLYKYRGNEPISMEIRHFASKLVRERKNGLPLPLEKDDPVYQGWLREAESPFEEMRKKIQDVTGISVYGEFTLNEYIKDITVNVRDEIDEDTLRIAFKFNHEDWTDGNRTADRYREKVRMPLHLRKVVGVSYHERDRKRKNAHYPMNVKVYVGADSLEHIYVECGERYTALNAKQELAQLGCLIKAVGLVNLNFSGGADYALWMLRVLYDDRITQGMMEEKLRQVLPDILRDKMKELQ